MRAILGGGGGDRSRLASIAALHSKETIRTNGSQVQQSRLFMKQITSERPIQGQKLGPSSRDDVDESKVFFNVLPILISNY